MGDLGVLEARLDHVRDDVNRHERDLTELRGTVTAQGIQIAETNGLIPQIFNTLAEIKHSVDQLSIRQDGKLQDLSNQQQQTRDRSQGFWLRHYEKIIFGVVVVFASSLVCGLVVHYLK